MKLLRIMLSYCEIELKLTAKSKNRKLTSMSKTGVRQRVTRDK